MFGNDIEIQHCDTETTSSSSSISSHRCQNIENNRDQHHCRGENVTVCNQNCHLDTNKIGEYPISLHVTDTEEENTQLIISTGQDNDYNQLPNRAIQILINVPNKMKTVHEPSFSNTFKNCFEESIIDEEIDTIPFGEIEENEMYARKVGVNFSEKRGNYLTMVENYSSLEDDDSLSDMRSNQSSTIRRGKHQSEKLGNIAEEVSEIQQDDEISPQTYLLSPKARKNMIDNDQDLFRLHKRASELSSDWINQNYCTPDLARRLRDFEFAQKKRYKLKGKAKKLGVKGLYHFLNYIKIDVEWAEDAAHRRAKGLAYLPWWEFVAQKKNDVDKRPYFTYTVLFFCTVFYLLSIGMNGWVFESFDVNPMLGPSADVLLHLGAKESNLIVNQQEIWRLIAPIFLHSGFVHYFLNCCTLLYIGKAVEQSHGFFHALVLFVVPAVGGLLVSAVFLPQFITVGASGGIFGLTGACMADIWINRNVLFSDFVNKGRSKKHHIKVIVILAFDIFINLIIGLTPFTDNFVHITGMCLGFLIGISTLNPIPTRFFGVDRSFLSTIINIFIRSLGLIISAVCIISVAALLFNGDGLSSPCEFCDKLSCISFPPWSSYEDKFWFCDDCGSVTANGKLNSKGIYVQLELHCPDSNSVSFYLEDDSTADRDWLEANLSRYCRQKCFN